MKKEKVTVTVEKDTDGRFACYVDKEFAHFGLAGYGDTVAEAKADLYACYNEMKELEEAEGRSFLIWNTPLSMIYNPSLTTSLT